MRLTRALLIASAGTVASRLSMASTACCSLADASLLTGCLLRVAENSWKSNSCIVPKVLSTSFLAALSLAALFAVAYSPNALRRSRGSV